MQTSLVEFIKEKSLISHQNLSSLQLQAFDIAMRPVNSTTRIVGYAGTGKTTVLSCVAREYGNQAIVLAPTNKAVMVLKEKGIDAKTIHSFLYSPQEIDIFKYDKDNNIQYHKGADGVELVDVNGDRIPLIAKKEMQFALRADKNSIPSTVLVDEASMVGEQMFNDLCETFQYVIMFGDGFQLPPVMDKDILNSQKPDIFLDEVHRVAFDNPIIRFATDIRNNIEPNILNYMKECQNKEIGHTTWKNTKLFQAIDHYQVQCICGTNRTRHMLNEKIREQKGYLPNTLMKGEGIVCLQNWRESVKDDDYGSVKKLIFYNGQLLETNEDLQQTEDDFRAIFVSLKGHGAKPILPFWNKDYFNLADDSTSWYNEFQRRKGTPNKPVMGIKMDYGYAITAHKAQGSEYDNVAVFDERSAIRGMSKKEKQRWYYTAVTRAKKRLLIVNNEKLVA